MANGFFLGGAADGMSTYADRQLKARALGLQEQQLVADQKKVLIDQADKAIADTMGLIGETVKGVASKADVGTGMDAWNAGITAIESGGRYDLLGPVTKTGDRAYGKYQVMGANIPEWTKEVLGRAMTPEQFLADQKAQDAVFGAKFNQYVTETGSPDRAALKWFTGRTDDAALEIADGNGTTGKEYVQRFAEVVSGQPRAKVKAAVAPLLKDVQDIATKVGKDPSRYENAVNAMLASTTFGLDAALKAGQSEAAKKIGETNGLIRAGVSAADAALTAGIKSAGDVGLDPNQIVSAESTMRNQYSSLAKDFVTVRDAYSRIQQSMSGTPAGDISLIFQYMKMLDPGSTVREGEFATAQAATGVPGQIVNLYNQLLGGQRLNPGQRQDFAGLAGKLYTAQLQQQTFLADQFRGIAKKSGLNPENVVIDFGGPKTATAASAGGKSTVAGQDLPPDHFLPGDKDRQAVWLYLPPDQRALWDK